MGLCLMLILGSGLVEDHIERAAPDDGSYFLCFKRYRKRFEQMASDKYDKGHVEVDGTVCIKARDLPLESGN
jgi:hypothetical protein